MLSLRSSNTSSSTKFRKKKYSSIKEGPVLWIDFTDLRTVYSDTSGTKANPNIDTIAVVDNKAFNDRFGRSSTLCTGTSLRQSDASKQPALISGGQNGHVFARFDGANDTLFANKSSGNVATNKLSDSRLNGQAITIFWVAKNDSATPGQEHLLQIQGHDISDNTDDPMTIGVKANNYHIFMGNASDKTGDVNQSSSRQATTNVELWTIRCAGSSSAYMYANGDTSDGITNGNTKDQDYALDANNTGCEILLGGGSWDGDIYEILMYSIALPDKEIKEIERRLKQKYNIT